MKIIKEKEMNYPRHSLWLIPRKIRHPFPFKRQYKVSLAFLMFESRYEEINMQLAVLLSSSWPIHTRQWARLDSPGRLLRF